MSDEKTIIVAEDESMVRSLIRAMFRKSAVRVLEAANGADVLFLARQERPDLLLLDLGLPGMDGYAVCRALKGDPDTAGIKVVMLTARAQRKDQEKGLEAGADEYITKPFSPQQLLANLLRLLG